MFDVLTPNPECEQRIHSEKKTELSIKKLRDKIKKLTELSIIIKKYLVTFNTRMVRLSSSSMIFMHQFMITKQLKIIYPINHVGSCHNKHIRLNLIIKKKKMV